MEIENGFTKPTEIPDRFRFRAWGKLQKRMIKNVRHCTPDNAFSSGGCSPFQDYINFENFIIMQCTGLKDINGKLIYEGDIFQFKEHTNVVYVVGFDVDKVAFCLARLTDYIEHEIKKFQWQDIWHAIANDWWRDYGSNEAEIIGNIYENPELLEDEKA